MSTINLTPFCEHGNASDMRSYLHAPFRQGAYVYATNGHVLIRVAAADAYQDVVVNDTVAVTTVIAAAAVDSDAGWQPLPPIHLPAHGLAPCDGCRGRGYGVACTICHYTGMCACNCDRCDRECDDCDGSGIGLSRDETKERKVCLHCGGRGRARDDRVVVIPDGPHLTAEYVAMVLALSGPIEVKWPEPVTDKYSDQRHHNMSAFRGPGWHVVLMARRPNIPPTGREIIVAMNDGTVPA